MKLKPQHLIQLAVPLIGLLLVPIVTAAHGGIGTTSDSASYVSAARSLLAGHGLLEPTGRLYEQWPPGYPLALAALSWLTRADVLAVAPWLNGLALAGVWTIAAGLLKREGRVGQVGWLWIAAGLPLLRIALNVMSDVLFMALVAGWLVALTRFYQRGRWWWLLIAAGLAALAGLTRYLGLALIIAGGLTILITPGLRRRWLWAAGYGALASIAPALWAARNLLLIGAAGGGRSPSTTSLAENIQRSAVTLAGWFLPVLPNPDSGTRLAVTGLVVLAGALVLYVIIRRPRAASLEALVPSAIFGVVYLALVVATASLVAYEPIGDRLLAPLYLPLLWGLVRVLCLVPGAIRRRGLLLVAGGGLGGISALWVVGLAAAQLVLGYGAWGGYRYYGYATAGATQYLQTHQLAAPIYSNGAAALYLYAGQAVEWQPVRLAYGTTGEAAPVSALVGQWPAASPAYLVFFNRDDGSHYTPAELSTVFVVEPVAVFADSGVYEVRGLRP